MIMPIWPSIAQYPSWKMAVVRVMREGITEPENTVVWTLEVWEEKATFESLAISHYKQTLDAKLAAALMKILE